MKKGINKTFKVCALCKNWNGPMGARSINVKPNGFFEIESTEENKCFETGFTKGAMSKCPKFSPRY